LNFFLARRKRIPSASPASEEISFGSPWTFWVDVMRSGVPSPLERWVDGSHVMGMLRGHGSDWWVVAPLSVGGSRSGAFQFFSPLLRRGKRTPPLSLRCLETFFFYTARMRRARFKPFWGYFLSPPSQLVREPPPYRTHVRFNSHTSVPLSFAPRVQPRSFLRRQPSSLPQGWRHCPSAAFQAVAFLSPNTLLTHFFSPECRSILTELALCQSV